MNQDIIKKTAITVFATIAVVIGIKIWIGQSISPLGPGYYGMPTWSTNGSYLAFSFRDTGAEELWVIEPDSGEVVQVKMQDTLNPNSGLAWENDEILWFVSRNRDRNNKLQWVNVSTGRTEIIVDIVSWGWFGFAFNPNRREIIFSQTPQFSTVSNPSHHELYSLDLNTQTVTQLTNTLEIAEIAPLWSPNSNYYASRWDGLILTDPITRVSYTVNAGVLYGINKYSWSPDGDWFLFVGDENGLGLYVVSTNERGEPRKVLSGPVNQVSWSPDGLRIAYTTVSVAGRGNELYIIPAEELGLTLLSTALPEEWESTR